MYQNRPERLHVDGNPELRESAYKYSIANRDEVSHFCVYNSGKPWNFHISPNRQHDNRIVFAQNRANKNQRLVSINKEIWRYQLRCKITITAGRQEIAANKGLK